MGVGRSAIFGGELILRLSGLAFVRNKAESASTS
jgi:hypothetical protein